MLWFLLCPIVFILALRYSWLYYGFRRADLPEKLFHIFGCGVAAGVAFLGALVIASLAAMCFTTYPVQVSNEPLAAVRTKDGTAGTFYFLGAGSIGEEQYYFYYTQNADGGFVPGKEEAGPWIQIYEDEETHPHLITYRWKSKYAWARWVALVPDEGGSAYDFHIPKGTIARGFSM